MRSSTLAKVMAATLLISIAAVVSAQLKLESLPSDLLQPSNWSGPEMLRPEADRSTASHRYPDFSAARWWASSSLYIEPARMVDGRYVRPRFNFGMPSETTRDLLRAGGVGARDCMLPMVRARVNLTGSDSNGAIWLFMRCTLD
ncbi:MAG: hypothetical protein RR101_08925 [Burkholderiaceae bacterium]